MTDLRRERFTLPTGVELDVTLGGPDGAPPIFFLHGFPESARTWRYQLDEFARDHRVFAPDQRGFARSSKPDGVENYTPDKPMADLFALADAVGVERFTLVGHDWGGAIAWGGALGRPDRVEKLAIVNAPHPFVFQRSMFDDAGQRAASQYITAFRQPGIEQWLAANLDAFYDRTFGHSGLASAPAGERALYLDEWSQPGAVVAMLNWYRGAQVIVPPVDGGDVARPVFLDQPFPVLDVPTLVVWGMNDTALTPSQLEGLDTLVSDLRIERVEGAGHFITWEKPEAVNDALRRFLR